MRAKGAGLAGVCSGTRVICPRRPQLPLPKACRALPRRTRSAARSPLSTQSACSLQAALLSDRCPNLRLAIGLGNPVKTAVDALAEGVETLLHPADAREKPGINQRGNGFAILADDNAVLPVLHLIQYFAEVLAESHCACLDDHLRLHWS